MASALFVIAHCSSSTKPTFVLDSLLVMNTHATSTWQMEKPHAGEVDNLLYTCSREDSSFHLGSLLKNGERY